MQIAFPSHKVSGSQCGSDKMGRVHRDRTFLFQTVHRALPDTLGAARRSGRLSQSAPPKSPAALHPAVREQTGRAGDSGAVGDEENADRQDGELAEQGLRSACCFLHKAVLAAWGYGYIADSILCY